MNSRTVEAEVIEKEQDTRSGAIAIRNTEQALARPQGNPLDMPPAMFKEGLQRRGDNRKALMEWIRASLVDGTDFARIHVVGKNRCGAGNQCTNPSHYSKPGLLKPGAEKICGMLGLQTTFPRLSDYEEACIKGVAIKQIILRCELKNEGGKIVGEGVGARVLEQDYNDINKSLKMAEKSAHIDATLRTAGLSEVFSQDEDDGFNKPEFQEPERNSNTRGMTGGNHSTQTTTQAPPTNGNEKAVNPSGKSATTQQRDRMLEDLIKLQSQDAILQWAQKSSILLPTETLLDWPMRYVPVTVHQMKLLVKAIADFYDGGEAVKPFTNPEPEPEKKPKQEKAPEVPRDEAVGEWRSFVVPFGKNKGKALGELAQNSLAWYCRDFKVSETYVGKNEKVYNKKPEQLAQDKAFRAALDAAVKELNISMEERQ